jgi:hypothetical protein
MVRKSGSSKVQSKWPRVEATTRPLPRSGFKAVAEVLDKSLPLHCGQFSDGDVFVPRDGVRIAVDLHSNDAGGRDVGFGLGIEREESEFQEIMHGGDLHRQPRLHS